MSGEFCDNSPTEPSLKKESVYDGGDSLEQRVGFMMQKSQFIGLMLSSLFLTSSVVAKPLLSTAERTDFRQTGRFSEARQLCHDMKLEWPDLVRWEKFGTSPEGREMTALVVTKSGVFEARTAKSKKLPVVLVQACIHAGEVCGKDAGFLAIKKLLNEDSSFLSNVILVFIPILNVDGHERFGAWNRPNQNGPEEMGWRVTSANLNLNRDYTKADSSEMRELLRYMDYWDPILYVDLHSTDGAQFQTDVSIIAEPVLLGSSELRPAGEKLLSETLQSLKARGSKPVSFYPSLKDSNDPLSGFSDAAFGPRYSTGYWALRNRLSLLVETHSWKDYKTRVEICRDIILSLVTQASVSGNDWLRAAESAERESLSLAGKDVVLDYQPGEKTTVIDFPGYEFHHESSPISDSQALVYDPSRPQNWRVPFHAGVSAKLTVRAPKGGYLIPQVHSSWMSSLLDVHGIEYHPFQESKKLLPIEQFRATGVKQAARSFEGRQRCELQGNWMGETLNFSGGALLVPIDQAKSRLVMALLEPEAPDSLAAWGFFNAQFEQKEYMERYVAEEVAKKMLAEDLELAELFQKKLETEPEFAKDSRARLNFFYQRHESWDERLNVYPVYRLEQGTLDRDSDSFSPENVP